MSPVLRLFIRYGIQAVLLLAPMTTMGFSLLNFVGHRNAGPTDSVQFLGLVGPKQEVELRIRIYLTVIAVVATLAFEAVDLYWPSRSLLRFRKRYLELQKKEWRSNLSDDVRINIMYARRRWYTLWLFVKVFEWTWNDGFAHPNEHRDANMWICEYQGACGKAFRSQKPQSVYFDPTPVTMTVRERWLFRNQFRLSFRQLNRTSHLRAVVSIPILEPSEELSPSYTSVGVINLDTSTETGSKTLHENEQALTEYFMRIGKILAALRL